MGLIDGLGQMVLMFRFLKLTMQETGALKKMRGGVVVVVVGRGVKTHIFDIKSIKSLSLLGDVLLPMSAEKAIKRNQ